MRFSRIRTQLDDMFFEMTFTVCDHISLPNLDPEICIRRNSVLFCETDWFTRF